LIIFFLGQILFLLTWKCPNQWELWALYRTRKSFKLLGRVCETANERICVFSIYSSYPAASTYQCWNWRLQVTNEM